MDPLTLLFLFNRGSRIFFDIYDRVERGEITPEQGLAEWQEQVSRIKAEEARFDKLMGDS